MLVVNAANLLWLGLWALHGATTIVNAALLSPRQQTTATSSQASSGPSSSPFIDPILVPISSVPGATASATNRVTQASSPTSSSSTVTNSHGTASGSLANSTTSSNPDHGNCRRTQIEYKSPSGPFCAPLHLQEVWVERTYSAIWDPKFYGHDANITVFLAYTTPPEGMDSDPVWNKTVQNSDSEVEIVMDPEWLQGATQNNLTFSLMASDRDGRSEDGGPTVSLITVPTPSATPSAAGRTHGSSKLGVEVGVPIAIVFIAAICIGLFLVLRRRRRGYVGGRTRSQRMKGHGDVKLTGDDFRTTTGGRRDGFKDEPLQGGVELQPRLGHRREDSMGGNLISPISPVSSAGRTSNAFRDEIERQRAGSGR